MILYKHNNIVTNYIIKLFNIPIDITYSKVNKWLYYNEYIDTIIGIGSEFNNNIKALNKYLFRTRERLFICKNILSFIYCVKKFRKYLHNSKYCYTFAKDLRY